VSYRRHQRGQPKRREEYYQCAIALLNQRKSKLRDINIGCASQILSLHLNSERRLSMIFKSTVVAVILLLGVLSVAKAQSKGGEVVGEGQLRSNEFTTQAVLGWNFFHVRNCYVDTNGTFLVFPVESSQINFLFISDIALIATLTPACQSGNLLAVFVTTIAGSNFTWNQLLTYTFK
jgi:hypothetical protein